MAPCTLRLGLVLVALATAGRTAAAQTRVACLGDSITFGAQVPERAHNSWPALLGELLGPEHEVRNFGVGGATLLRAADRPYAGTKRCAEALAWRPDLAVIVLGTNDTCQNERRHNWQHEADLEADARALIADLRAANSDARVLLCSPTSMFPDRKGLAAARRANLEERAPRLTRIAAAVRTVAASMQGVEYLELRTTLRPGDVTDGVHTTPFGCERIARRVAYACANPLEPAPALQPELERRGLACTASTFHDFAALEFTLPQTGAAGRIVRPHGAASGLPWILRARFFGHQPGLDLALLKRGFHLVWCDVADLYGAPAAMARWDEFYHLLRDLDFAPRGVLEGMSRGGLPIINWAAADPERVAAIYGDNPVADFRSWPGGQHGKRADGDWQRCLAAYGLDEPGAAAFDRMPIDRLEPIAKAGIPLLLVLGMADEVVPPAENGEQLAARQRALGGSVQVWRKPGLGHHPHGLAPVDPLLRAVLRATGRAPMPSVQAAPAVEYRRGAGWSGSWRSEFEKLQRLAEQHREARLVFLGDSITQGLTGAGDRVARADGERPIDQTFGDLGALSLGLSGDRTEHLLYRIEHGALRTLAPAVIVLNIGVNNVNAAKHTAAETAAGIAAVVRALADHEPQAKVVLCGPFPLGRPDEPRRHTIDAVHEQIASLGELERVLYRDLRGLFLNPDGTMNERMRSDRVHASRAGQVAWMQAIASDVRAALAPR